jgi:hypothetical protein
MFILPRLEFDRLYIKMNLITSAPRIIVAILDDTLPNLEQRKIERVFFIKTIRYSKLPVAVDALRILTVR